MLKKIEFPIFSDDRGDLGVVEFKDFVDWEVKRFYYVVNVTKPRGGHCVKGEKKFYICLKGKVTAKFFDGSQWMEFELNGPNQGVLMEGDYWREFDGFSEDGVLAVLSSMNYESDKYIMDIKEFESYIESK